MTLNKIIELPDVVLIGSGIMSATLGAILKRLDPTLRIQLLEVTSDLAQEASHGWHNAGTGHAGICELSYTPNQHDDGSVDVTKAINVFQEFEQSKQFWAQAVATGMLGEPQSFLNAVPHVSFVYGEKQVAFLQARYEAMSAHHFFSDMEFTTDSARIAEWAPLLTTGRAHMPVAATRMESGTDVNFGEIARQLVTWLGQQEDCGVATGHRVTNLHRNGDEWSVEAHKLESNQLSNIRTKFVFVGAGGGSLQLLQKAALPEIRGYGGFPVGGQWLVCDNPEIVSRHQAKVYGQAQDEAPTMAVPHLDTRVIDNKRWLLFGPFAAWTTKFLHEGGSWTDLAGSLRVHNLLPLMKVGLANLPLVKYLIQQGTQSMAARLELLRTYYPEAREEDWRLIDAGIRVQAIKKEDGATGIVHYGTEVVTDKDNSLAALLGASPGASVSTSIMMNVVQQCFPQLVEGSQALSNVQQWIPSYGHDLIAESGSELYQQLNRKACRHLQLTL